MTDFKRLIEEVDSELARAVLESGRSMQPNAARRRQVLAALGVGLVIGTTHKLSLAALSTWQKMALVGGVACVGAGGAFTYSQLTAPAPAVDVAYAEAPAPPAPLVRRGTATPEPEVADVEVEQVEVESATAPARAGGRATRAAEPKLPESSMKAELALLEQARSQLRGGSPNAALDTLNAYRERYPRGNMGLEAEVLRVEALAAAGRTREAARLADKMLARHPKSVVASRLRRFASKE